MSWNLPDDVTDEMIDRAAGGYDEPEPEEPEGGYARCPVCKRTTWTESGCLLECACGYQEDEGEARHGA